MEGSIYGSKSRDSVKNAAERYLRDVILFGFLETLQKLCVCVCVFFLLTPIHILYQWKSGQTVKLLSRCN